MDLECVINDPEEPHAHTHTGIFLHGRGDTADNFAASLMFSRTRDMETIFSSLPTFRWVFPQSERRRPWYDEEAETESEDDEEKDEELVEVRTQGRSQWFDIYDFGDFSKREKEVAGVGLRESVASILKIIDREAALLGGRREKIVLLGISQGAAVGMHVLMNMPRTTETETKADGKTTAETNDNAGEPDSDNKEKAQARHEDPSVVSTGSLGAFVGFSSWLPYIGRTLSEMREVLNLGNEPDDTVLKGTPVLMEHCQDDWTIAFRHGEAAKDALESFGASVESKWYSRGGHWFKSPEGIEDAVNFIKNHVLGLSVGM